METLQTAGYADKIKQAFVGKKEALLYAFL